MLNANPIRDLRLALARAASGGHQTLSQSLPSSRHESSTRYRSIQRAFYWTILVVFLFKLEARPLDDLIPKYLL